MKKILSLCAVVLTAMSMSAAVQNMTCAEAATAALALGSGATGTDSVAVTGYVTYTDGNLSSGQQKFYLDDVKGTTKTFYAYWCNMPTGEEALSAGDKVTVTGLLMNYNSTAEMKNGNVVILERAVIVRDTTDTDVCEAVGEALSLTIGEDSENSYYHLTGITTSANDVNTYGNQTFYFTCTEGSDSNKTLQIYGANLGTLDAIAVGDTVEVVGKLMNYSSQAEMTSVKILDVKRNSVIVKVDTIKATVAEAVAAGLQLASGASSTNIYVVTGYVDSVAYAWTESKGTTSFYMSDAHDYSKTFEAYYTTTTEAFAEGDKVQVTGKLKNYNGLIEISNGTGVMISRTALDEVESAAAAEKVMINGVLYIRKAGELFTVTGVKL